MATLKRVMVMVCGKCGEVLTAPRRKRKPRKKSAKPDAVRK